MSEYNKGYVRILCWLWKFGLEIEVHSGKHWKEIILITARSSHLLELNEM